MIQQSHSWAYIQRKTGSVFFLDLRAVYMMCSHRENSSKLLTYTIRTLLSAYYTSMKNILKMR